MADPIEDGLRHAIDRWLNIEGNTFGFGKKLSNMWLETKGAVTDFQPDGVLELIDKVQDETVFKDNQRAQDLETGQFGPDRIDTFGDLFDHLSGLI